MVSLERTPNDFPPVLVVLCLFVHSYCKWLALLFIFLLLRQLAPCIWRSNVDVVRKEQWFFLNLLRSREWLSFSGRLTSSSVRTPVSHTGERSSTLRSTNFFCFVPQLVDNNACCAGTLGTAGVQLGSQSADFARCRVASPPVHGLGRSTGEQRCTARFQGC